MKSIQYIDPSLTCLDIAEILDEDMRQVAKWGIQVRSPFEWLAYLTEEVGELSQAISEYVYHEGDAERIKKEAIQVATLAMKIGKMSMLAILKRKEEK